MSQLKRITNPSKSILINLLTKLGKLMTSLRMEYIINSMSAKIVIGNHMTKHTKLAYVKSAVMKEASPNLLPMSASTKIGATMLKGSVRHAI